MARFSKDQRTLTIGDDKPLPGGFANGVGNLSPQTPLTKWGVKFERKAPPKKQAK